MRSIVQLTEELERIERRRKEALSGNQIGIWEWDVKEDALIWDEKMLDIYGVTDKEFSGNYNAWASCLHPDDLQETRQNLKSCVENENKRYFYRFRVKRGNGWIWVSGIGSAIKNSSGEVVRVVGINIEEPPADGKHICPFFNAPCQLSNARE